MKKEDTEFDFQKALEAIQDGQPLLGNRAILTPLVPPKFSTTQK